MRGFFFSSEIAFMWSHWKKQGSLLISREKKKKGFWSLCFLNFDWIVKLLLQLLIVQIILEVNKILLCPPKWWIVLKFWRERCHVCTWHHMVQSSSKILISSFKWVHVCVWECFCPTFNNRHLFGAHCYTLFKLVSNLLKLKVWG